MSDEGLQAAVLSALNRIVDPCSVAASAPAGLVDMGLVREVAVVPEAEGWAVKVSLSVTHPFCLMAGIFIAEAEKELRSIRAWSTIEVTLDSKTLWSPELMSPEYRDRLAEIRARKGLAP